MAGTSFNDKAYMYENNGLVQKMSSQVLLDLLKISDQADVLDLGCGPGGVSRKIAELTKGKVVGVDVSEGMINQAVKSSGGVSNLSFEVKDAENLGFIENFDVIFCNSAFQWFSNPFKVIEQCYQALRNAGVIGIQAPATRQYCPAFLAAINEVKDNPHTGPIFAKWNNPYYFLDSAEEYAELFEKCGFKIEYCELVHESNLFFPEEVYGIFASGAENGYLNQNYYATKLTDEYVENFRSLVRASIANSATVNGQVNLEFTRIYLMARK